MCALSVTLDQYFFMRTGKSLITLHGFGMLIWVCAVLACYFIDFTVPWLVPKCVYNGAMRKPVYAICEQQGRRSVAHPRSLISAIVVRCLDSTIPLVSISKISSLYLASVAAQAGLSQPWSQTPKTCFLATRLNA